MFKRLLRPDFYCKGGTRASSSTSLDLLTSKLAPADLAAPQRA
jgi:hypothetical protein